MATIANRTAIHPAQNAAKKATTPSAIVIWIVGIVILELFCYKGVGGYAMDMIINIIIWLIIAGFIYWAVKLIIGLLPIDDWFKQIINVLIMILVAAIVLFKILIPVLQYIAHMGSGGFNFNLH
jgi:hypothetical protein